MEKDIDNIEVSTLLSEQDPNRHIRILIVMISIMVALVVLWSTFTTVDELTKAPGTIQPSGQSQLIKHIDGGKIKSIAKNNGEFIKKGESILTLEPNQNVADRDTLTSRKESLELEIIRHEYFIAKSKRDKSAVIEKLSSIDMGDSKDANLLISETKSLIEKERKSYESKIALLQEDIDKEQTSFKQLKKQLDNRKKRLEILKQASDMYEELGRSNSVSKIKVIDAREKYNETEAELLSIESQIEEQLHVLDQKHNELTAFSEKYSFDNLQSLNKARSNLNEVNEALEHYIEQSEELTIKATESGVIQDLNFDIGAVISPGEKILEIVPSQRDLIVKAKLESKDIANINLGNKVKVRVESYNYVRYGTLDGIVESISASTFKDSEQSPSYYKINIRINEKSLNKSSIKLMPGMTIYADIVSGKRTVIEYMLRPIIHSMRMSLTEK